MKRYSVAASLGLAVLVVLGQAGPVAAGEQVPFQGRLEGSFTITPVPGGPPTLVDVLLNATGNATHLGKYTLSFPHRVDRSTMPSTGIGIYTFTAANGDMVFADVSGQATPTGIPGVLHGVETATITGGTGRFANASGSFICERLIDTINRQTFEFFSGTISAPGDENP